MSPWEDCCNDTLDRYEEDVDLPDLPNMFQCDGCETRWRLVWDGPDQVYAEAG